MNRRDFFKWTARLAAAVGLRAWASEAPPDETIRVTKMVEFGDEMDYVLVYPFTEEDAPDLVDFDTNANFFALSYHVKTNDGVHFVKKYKDGRVFVDGQLQE